MVIEIQELQKVVDGHMAVDIPELTVNPGQIVASVGPVGSKLSIIFELLIGRERPTAGRIRISGSDPYRDREQFSRQVGVLFAEDNLYLRQSAKENLNFYRRLYKLPVKRVDQVLDEVGLVDHADVKVDQLSSSLKRRLAFGRAIIHNPEVLIVNGPFTNCDSMCVDIISKLIRQYSQDGLATMILAHDDDHLSELCDIILLVEQGKVTDTIYPGEEDRQSFPFMIPAKLEHTVALVDPADIFYAFAQDDRTYLQTEEGSLPTQFTMTELEQRLSRSGFFRAHRGYLVNLQHVKEVIPYTRDSYSLRLKDPERTKIPLSKTAARELREILGY
jgi:ABC-2 type transport system ATP-binding protein